MNILELDSYNLADAVKFNDRLNPRLWDKNEHLLPVVHEKLLAIADDFREFLGVTGFELKDITLSGSNAAYTYTPNSDIDLHLVVDLPQADASKVYRELFDAKKYQYNDQHNISIGGYPVELYVQDANKAHHSQGIYSVLNNQWIDVPKRRDVGVDDISTRSKYEDLAKRIDTAVESNDHETMANLMKKIKAIRQTGLDKHGEFGPENLAFKMLRSQGAIKRLVDARDAAKDHELSLRERARVKKPFVYGFKTEDVGSSWDGVNPTTQMFLNEKPSLSTQEIVSDFVNYCVEQLSIEHDPIVKFKRDPAWSARNKTFGRYTKENNVLEVSLAGRHVMDVLRTVAHELTHQRQNEVADVPDHAGETGSDWENEANAKAGVLMREYAQRHPEYFADGQIEESSGYIPTKAQAKDPRFKMALTKDVRPGATGKEANKLNLHTDSQGHPGLLMTGLANSLKEFKETGKLPPIYEDELFEINMGPASLRKEAAKTGAIAGMEFEMIVPNVEGDDEDAEPEPDWDYDQSVGGISDAVDFFDDAGQNSRRDLERLRERMQENYEQWLSESFDSRWDGDELEFIFNYIKENASAEEIAEIMGTEPNEDGEYPDPDKRDYLDAANKISEQGYGNYWYDSARENAQEEFYTNADQESEWLEDQEINTMQDVMNTFGTVDWPHWNTPGTGGDRSIEDVANDFQDAIGRDVQASGRYHSGEVERPSTKSDHYVVEPDGSLEGDDYGDKGLEFVSPPLPIDVMINDLNKVKRWAKANGCYTNDSTGLHINISVPDFDRSKLDFVKLAILMGDEYILDQFGRKGNFYAKSAMKIVKDRIAQNPDDAQALLDKMKGQVEELASRAIHSGHTEKYTSINVKSGHIEFRSPGGDWLDENFDKIENTLLRFTVALSAAMNPEMYRQEYLKKLYKILAPEGSDDSIKYFAKYAAGELPQAALKSFVRQAQLDRKLKKDPTGGKRYWWKVTNPGNSNAGIEVVATTKQEAIEKAIGADGYPSWANNKRSLVVKPLSPYQEKSDREDSAEQTPKYEIYNKQTGNSVEPADGITNDADALVRLNDYIEHGPHALQRGQATAMFGIRPVNQASTTAPRGREYQIFDQNSQQTAAAFLAPSDEAALARLLQYQRRNPDDPYGVRTANGVEVVDIDIPMAPGRAAQPGSTTDLQQQRTAPGTFTGAWKVVVSSTGEEVYRFSGIGNNQGDANRVAADWARRSRLDDPIEVLPIMS